MIPEQTIEFRYDTQLLIAFWQSAATETRSRSTIIPMSPGWYLNTAVRWVKSMI